MAAAVVLVQARGELETRGQGAVMNPLKGFISLISLLDISKHKQIIF